MLLTVSDVARRLAVSEATVRRLERTGTLVADRTPKGRRLFESGAVDDFRQCREVQLGQSQRPSCPEQEQ